MSYKNPEHLVECDWLEANLDDPNLRILDCHVDIGVKLTGGMRFDSGRAAWKKGHIPGTDFIDFCQELSAPDAEVEFTLPSAEQFTEAMQRHGVSDGMKVVVYDTLMNIWAARLWLMLRHFGFGNAAVLNGGLQKWNKEGRRLSSETPEVGRGSFVAKEPEQSLFTDKDEVQSAMTDSSTCLLDTLTPDVYSGENTAGRAGMRKGHIPSAVNVPFAFVVDQDTHAYLPADQLAEQFAAREVTEGERLITYCGAGIAASSVALALSLMGRDNVAVYDGSLFEWADDPALPMET